MNPRFLLLVLLLPAAGALARERVEERTFPVGGAAALTLATYGGTITVESSEENVVRVKVTASSVLEDDEAAGRALARLQLDWQQAGDQVTVTAGNAHETGVRFLWHEADRLDVDIVVAVPRACTLDLESGDGAIRVGDITGNVRVKTGMGLIFCRHIDGALAASTRSGDIIVSGCQGDVTLSTQGGFIRTGPVRGKATVTAVGGDIEMLCVNGGLVARADAGDITVGIPRYPSGPASVRTAGGNITLKIDPAANVDIDASSVWGRVRAMPASRPGLPLTAASGGLGRHALVARVNAGGTVIEAHANGGHVNLMGEVPPFS